jgi:hypothetical protein
MSKKSKKSQKSLSISIEPSVYKILDEGGYNKSKFINNLLKDYIQKEKQK